MGGEEVLFITYGGEIFNRVSGVEFHDYCVAFGNM